MKRILLLYTGGTVGCEGDPLAPMQADRFALRLAEFNVVPTHVHCELRSLPEPLDSANMRPADWLDIATALTTAWAEFDGFVVLHGTDTLAYTAAALSFLLVGLDKPIVLTGSQHPLTVPSSDAPRNLTDAIAVACEPALREVAVCFAGRVLRGNRSVKRSAEALDAFVSPNLPELGFVKGGVVSLNADVLLPVPRAGEGVFDPALVQAMLAALHQRFADSPVWAIQLHPGFPVAVLEAALLLPNAPRGWLLACYGTGNAQTEILDAVRAARARGVAVVAVTQTGHGVVDLTTYLAGAELAGAGVISARDMTLPAALVKLQVLLASGLSVDEMAMQMSDPLAGEVTAAR